MHAWNLFFDESFSMKQKNIRSHDRLLLSNEDLKDVCHVAYIVSKSFDTEKFI